MFTSDAWCVGMALQRPLRELCTLGALGVRCREVCSELASGFVHMCIVSVQKHKTQFGLLGKRHPGL